MTEERQYICPGCVMAHTTKNTTTPHKCTIGWFIGERREQRCICGGNHNA